MDLMKNRTALTVAGTAIACVLLACVSIVPLMAGLKEAGLERELLIKKIIEARRQIPREEFLYAEKSLISEKEVSNAIDEFTSQGKSMSIDFISIAVGSAEKGNGYRTLPLAVEARATYKEMGTFLESLRMIKRYVMRLKSLRMFQEKEGSRDLYASMVINLYLTADGNGK